tara:strand:+ start:605 stop:1012 length:408 start_codon:yes stop_codon:yes gene_type:complete
LVTGHEIHEYLGINSKHDCFGVYIGWQQIADHRAPLKIGRSKNAQAIQRGRAQGGADWWFGSYFLLPDNDATRIVERQIKALLKGYNIKGTQRQTELYSIDAEQARHQIKSILIKLGYRVEDIVPEVRNFTIAQS